VTSMSRGWDSVTTLPWAWLAAGLAASALFAGGVSLFSHDSLHRLWGLSAACAYALAALAVLAYRSRGTRGVDIALGVMLCGAILFPLLWMVAHGNGEPEVGVVARSATTLIKDGTPYRSSQALANTTNPNQYNPYLPLMAVFGVPQALFGHSLITDPRVWFGTVFLVVFASALRIAGAKDCVRWALLLTASPIIAFELCVGGTDVPMVAFLCLGFALLWRPQGANPVTAGLALGIASAMKATAWPALVVAFALLYVRDGQRAAWRFTAVALSVVVVIVGPFAVLKPGSLVKNTILFPLGLASVKSQAASPLLGHVLAQTGPVGHTIVVILLIASGLAIAVSLVVRPPRDHPAGSRALGHVRARAVDPVRLLHLPSRDGAVAASRPGWAQGRRPARAGRARLRLGRRSPAATPRTTGRTTGPSRPAGRYS
jgi:hypothetical protein